MDSGDVLHFFWNERILIWIQLRRGLDARLLTQHRGRQRGHGV